MRLHRALILGICTAFSNVAAAQVLDLPADPNVRACTETQKSDWLGATNDALGVLASDPWHGNIGSVAAVKSSAIVPTWAEYLLGALFLGGMPAHTIGRQWNWVPITGAKETMCGTLAKFEFYSNQAADKEEDATLYLRPMGPRFLALFDLGRQGSNSVEDCLDGVANCMEAEITLPPAARGTIELPTNNNSVLAGRAVCAFGPYVGEFVHGSRPEIHPAQGLWWTEVSSPEARKPLILLAAQDASTRFDSKDDFTALSIAAPDGWQPWASSPVTTTFRVAVSVHPAVTEPTIIWVLTVADVSVVTGSFADIAAGGPLELHLGGRSLMTVADLTGGRSGVGLEDVCWNGTEWLGMLRISTAVGKDHDHTGFHRMLVYFSESKPDLATRRKLNVVLAPRIDPKTLRIAADGGARADVSVIATTGNGSPRSMSLDSVRARRRPSPWKATGTGQWEMAVGNLTLGAPIVLVGADRQTQTLNLPSLRWVSSVTALPVKMGARVSGAGAWPFDATKLPESLSRVQVAEWAFVASMEAVMVSKGVDLPEDDGGVAGIMNEALLTCLKAKTPVAGACDRLGPSLPARVTWVVNKAGRRVESRPELQIRATSGPAWLTDAILRVKRGAAPGVPETLTLNMTILDRRGKASKASYSVPGEILTASNPTVLAAGLRELFAGRRLSVAQLNRLAAAAADGWTDAAKVRQALGNDR